MAEQLDHLVLLGETGTAAIRVLPLDSGTHAAAFGAFTLIHRPDEPGPFLACAEDRAGIRYLENPGAVELHRVLFNHLCEFALSVNDSTRLISETAKEYT